METVVEVEGNAEAKFEETYLSTTSSAPNSLKLIPDPVVYQLVRRETQAEILLSICGQQLPRPKVTTISEHYVLQVEGDGRLVPATDDEIMEVEDLLEDGKSELHLLPDIGGTVECTPISEGSSDKTHLKGSEGLFQFENLELDSEKSRAVVDAEINLVKPSLQTEEIVPSKNSDIHQSGGEQCSNPQGGLTESESPTSTVCSSWKPDFSKLKGEICLDNLSVRELHETFRATFGRETSVKDKQWLKRRIAMGLTNSCDVSTTTFIIEDNRVVRKLKEGKSKIVDGKHAKDPVVGTVDEICGGSSSAQEKQMESHFDGCGKRLRNPSIENSHDSEETCMEQRAVKRVRKPTRRYIEEVSEGESRENSGKLTSPVKTSGHSQQSPKTCVRPIENVRSGGRSLVTRQDSLGGYGIQIPYVSRVRRSRPRENLMALMKLQPTGMGMAAKLVKKAFGVSDSRPETEKEKKVVKARLSPGWVQQPLISKSEESEEYSERKTTESDNDDASVQQMGSSDNSDDNTVTVPTAYGGMRRKHHRPWTLSEVVKLVEGVARYGVGRWSEIKKVSFASISYRTSVDLKDKWRNLLRASQLPEDKGMDNSRKHGSIPIPAPVLVRVRELAEMQAQVPPNLTGGKFVGHSGGRSVHEMRPGYL